MKTPHTFARMAALVAPAASLHACGAATRPYSLDSGRYDVKVGNAVQDTCWEAPSTWPPAPLDFMFDLEREGDAFLAKPVGIAALLFPPFSGETSGNALSGSGVTVLTVTTNCSIAVDLQVSGALDADDEFAATFHAGLTARIANSAGTSSDCSALAGKSIGAGLIPFPAALGANGDCSITLSTVATAIGPVAGD